MKQRTVSIVLIFVLVLSMLANVSPAKAEDPFLLADADRDGLSNTMESAGWYSLAGGPFITGFNDADSDDDGLTDGEEKLFNTHPLDDRDPGLAAKYNNAYKTKQYFSTSDPAYLPMEQGGQQYLLTEAIIVRRGLTVNITGPASATLTATGDGMTVLYPERDPAVGGWRISLPSNGTVGTYTLTVTDGDWSKSMPLYVIFELPTTLPEDQVAAFLYDDDVSNKKDEVAVFWSMQEWKLSFPCPQPNNQICSNWDYHVATGYAQAFWTEQFKKSVFVDHAIKAIHGKTTQSAAAPAIATWADSEFRTRSGKVKNSWSNAMYKWNDGTGLTMDGAYCETTSTVFTTILRSAGLAARPFTMDYNKTAGHSEAGQIGTPYEYDHAVMIWLDNTWKAQRSYNKDEVADLYYPWPSGTTGISTLETWDTYSGYYKDNYADTIVSANAGWDFQNGNNGGGVVNTIWPMSVDQRLTVNQDYYWKSNWPLQITQSPYVDVLNCHMWLDDNWAPGEWRDPPVSNPAGRTAVQSYNLPAGIPDPANPLENWPYNPKPTACSASTPTSVCNAFKAAYTTSSCTPPGFATSNQGQSLQQQQQQSLQSYQLFIPAINAPSGIQKNNLQLGDIIGARGIDSNNDGLFEKLVVSVKVTSSQNAQAQFGGWLKVGEQVIRGNTETISLAKGEGVVEVGFEGMDIGTVGEDGPYVVEALWAADPNQPTIPVIDPENMLDYKQYAYATEAFESSSFDTLSATLADEYSHIGIDENGNGLYESITVEMGFDVVLPDTFVVEADLYDAKGEFVGHANWTGSDSPASLTFDVTKSQPPYTLEHVNLIQKNGPILDSRYAPVYTIDDVRGRIEAGAVAMKAANIGNGLLDVDPNGTITFTGVDTDSDGLYNKLVANVGVTVTSPVIPAGYRIEGLLVDAQGTPVAWGSSSAQVLSVGTRTMTLDFDGGMLYEQLPLGGGSESFRLVAVKIYSGNLSTSTLESQLEVGPSTSALTRSQFDLPTTANRLFEDDMESGNGKWTAGVPMWTNDTGTWRSWSHAWVANANQSSTGSLTSASALDLTNYAEPVLRFDNAHWMRAAGDIGKLEVSTNGDTWTTVKTYTGRTPHWGTEMVDLSAYEKTPNVKFRFLAQSAGGTLWYIDNVFVNAWPAVTSATITAPGTVVAGTNTTLTGGYTSIVTNLPVTYKWNLCGVTRETSSTNLVYNFPNAGACEVSLTVENPYDSATTTKTIQVTPSANQYVLTTLVSPQDGGSVAKNPDKPAYNSGDSVTLTATPSTGYVFSGWSGSGCSGTGTCVVTMNASKTVTANFTPIEYTLAITVTGSGTVTKSPNKATYHYGEEVTLTPVPAEHWNFSMWGGDVTGITVPAKITMNGNKNVSATFIEGDYALTINVVGSGSVTKDPELAFYPANANVNLSAAPDPGWSFSGWSGDLTSSANPTTIKMDKSKTITATFTQIEYTLNVTATGQGTITKEPLKTTYHYGDSVVLTPVGAAGWTFSGWSGGGCSGTQPCTVVINGNTTVSGAFTQNQYTLTITSPHGTVTKSPNQGTYVYGTEVTLTMGTVEPGWTFTGWGVSGCSGTDPCKVTVTGNTTVEPIFTRDTYTLTVNIVGGSGGMVTRHPEGPTYYYGDVVELEALPTSGWSFGGWSGDASGMTNKVNITMDGNKDVTATFTQDDYELFITIVGQGEVTLDKPGPYHYHDMVVMTAVPANGWIFKRWDGAREGPTNPMGITINEDTYVTATFEAIPYTFTTSVVGQGTITKSPDKPTYIYGDQVTVTATPEPGWTFKEWGGSCTGAGSCVVTVDGNENVTATFIEGATTYSVSVTVAGSGTVTKSPDQATYPLGATVQLTAEPSPGWTFAGWTGDVTSMANPVTLTVDGNKQVTATFTQNEYTLTVNTTGTGTVTKAPQQNTYHYGDQVVLTATEGSGFTFTGWSGDATGNANPLTVTVTKNMTITAAFSAQEYTLTVSAGTGGTVTKNPDKPTYLMGETVSLTAVPADHYNFKSWGGAISGSTNPVEVVISGDMTVTADFEAKQYNFTVYVSPVSKGTVTATPGPYYFDTDVTLNAQNTVPGWSFSHWTDGATEATHKITITGDTTIGAIYVEDQYTLTLLTTGEGTTQADPTEEYYYYGDYVTLTAEASTGWTFIRWEWANGGSSDNPLTVEMDSSKLITAVFQQSSFTYNLGGSIVGQGTMTVAITPIPVEGWSFERWSGDCTGSGDCALELNGSKNVTAIFTQNAYTLDLDVTGEAHGSVAAETQQDTYLHGNVVALTAAPAEGYMVDWGSACSRTSGNTCTVIMTEDTLITANFVQDPRYTGMLNGAFRLGKLSTRSERSQRLIPAL